MSWVVSKHIHFVICNDLAYLSRYRLRDKSSYRCQRLPWYSNSHSRTCRLPTQKNHKKHHENTRERKSKP